MTYILKEEISKSYINNVLVRELATQYEQKDGTYETLMNNLRIRKFIFKYLNTMNRRLQYIKYTERIFLSLKTIICSNHIIIVRFYCLHQEQKSTPDIIRSL